MPPWVLVFDSVKRTNLNGASTMDKVPEVCAGVPEGWATLDSQSFARAKGIDNCTSFSRLVKLLFHASTNALRARAAATAAKASTNCNTDKKRGCPFWIPCLFMSFELQLNEGHTS